MLSKFISLPIFLVSLAVGFFFVYLSTPQPTIIYVYPTPDNLKKIEYKDKADNCFQFNSTMIDCPLNKKIKTIPVQS